jgi:hypothetical protein
VKVLSKWVKCKIFELMKGQNKKKNQKPLYYYSCPIHHCCRARFHRARGSLMKVCCARKVLTKGDSTTSLTVMQISLQLTYKVKVSLLEPWS